MPMTKVDGVWTTAINITSAGTSTVLLQTQNTFVDANIAIKPYVPTVGAATLNITDKGSTDIGIGTVSGGYYPLTTSLIGQMTFASNGWITTAGVSATDSTVTVGRIAQSTLSEGSSSSGTETISVTPSPTANKYVNITAGYNDARYVTIAPMSSGTTAAATVNVSGAISNPTMADASSTINGMTQISLSATTTAPTTANGKYYVALSVTASGLVPTVTNTVTTAGYLAAGANSDLISVGTNSIAGGSNLYYSVLPTASISIAGSTAATTPTAANLSTGTISGKLHETPTAVSTNSASVTSSQYYALTIEAPATTVTAGVPSITAGYIGSGDTAKVTSSFATTQTTKTYYIAIQDGSLSAGDGSVNVTSGNVSLTNTNAQPSSGFYITAEGSGIVGVGTKGWLPASATASSNTKTTYYTIPTASFTVSGNMIKTTTNGGGYIANNTQIGTIGTGNISTTSTDPASGYTENTTAIVPSGGYLLIDAGYYEATKISLATLVPDATSNTAAAVGHILEGYKAYDKDGTLLTGTIPTYGGAYTFTAA